MKGMWQADQLLVSQEFHSVQLVIRFMVNALFNNPVWPATIILFVTDEVKSVYIPGAMNMGNCDQFQNIFPAYPWK